MKILVLGTGKSGTTALVYKMAGGLPNCLAFSGGRPGKYTGDYTGDYENAVYKHTYEERKGKDFDLFKKHLAEAHYDRNVWIARDPRDVAVSRMLYRWHRGYKGRKDQYRAYLDLILRKEQEPRSVSFHAICRYAGHKSWPITTEEVLEKERVRYEAMLAFVKSLDSEWFLFKYEDMLGGNLATLDNYLGFEIRGDAEIPGSKVKAKVIRKKATGDWRDWFTEEDVELFKPVYLPYMAFLGYNCTDWALSLNPRIEPEYSSKYVKSLLRRRPLDTVRKIKDRLVRYFGPRGQM